MDQTQNRHTPTPDARERLLAAALKLFTERSYAAASVREICAAAGVTKPVLYYYFKNKEGLYLTLMQEPFAAYDKLLSSVPDSGTVTARLLDFGDRLFRLFMEHLDAARLMYAIYYGPPQGAPFFDFEVYHLKMHDLVNRLVAEGMACGDLADGDPEDLAWIIIGAINIVLEEQLCQRHARLDRGALRRLLTLVLNGCSRDRAQGGHDR